MKLSIIHIILICVSYLAHGQDCNFLDTKNGFRNIKLGTSISDYPEFQKREETNAALFKLSMNAKANYVYVGNENEQLSGAKILFIYLIINDTKISEIKIVTEKVLSVYATLKFAYGEPTQKYNDKLIWRTNQIECSIEGDCSQVPGYHITYKKISDPRKELIILKEKSVKEAQKEL